MSESSQLRCWPLVHQNWREREMEDVLERDLAVYSGTSDKGPSDIGTTSLQLVVAPC